MDVDPSCGRCINLCVFVVTRPALQARLASLLSLDRNDARILIWQTAVEMIKDRPLTGVGGGVFPLVYNEYRLDSGTKAFSFAHNLPLQILAEFGLLGFIPFAGMVGLALVRGWRLAWRSGPLIISIYAGFIGMLVHDMVDNVTYGMNLGGLFWFLMGFLVHLERKQRLQGNTS